VTRPSRGRAWPPRYGSGAVRMSAAYVWARRVGGDEGGNGNAATGTTTAAAREGRRAHASHSAKR
jgi:hypothetical protein